MLVRVVSILAKACLLAACFAIVLSANAAATEVGMLKCRFNGVDAAVHFGAK